MDLTEKEIRAAISTSAPNLTSTNIDNILAISTYAKISDKEMILKGSKNVFFILKGVVRGYIIDDKGVEKNIYLRTEGYFGGDIENMFYNKPSRYIFEAIGQTHILIFTYSILEEFALSNRVFMRWYANMLKEIIYVLNYRIESMVTMSAKERYKNLIKRNPKFIHHVYDKYIANYLGITPVSFSRLKKEINLTTEN